MIHKGKAGCFTQRSASWTAEKYPHPIGEVRREAEPTAKTEPGERLTKRLKRCPGCYTDSGLAQLSNAVARSPYAPAAETAGCTGSDCELAWAATSWSSRWACAIAEDTSLGLHGDAIRSTAP
jgi:hypothetical protein